MNSFDGLQAQSEASAQQLADAAFLSTALPPDTLAMMQNQAYMTATLGRHGSIDATMMASFAGMDPFEFQRSISHSGSSQSQSPTLPDQFPSSESQPGQIFNDPFTNTFDPAPPMEGQPQSTKESDDESQRAEVSGITFRPEARFTNLNCRGEEPKIGQLNGLTGSAKIRV